MEINGFGWHEQERSPSRERIVEMNRRYHETALEAFGVDRCMFESNFPVDKVSYSYGIIWNTFKRLTAGYSPGEKGRLFHDNAHRIYRLD